MEIYDQLLRFSLFQGMSHADLMEVVTHTKLGFLKLATGKILCKEGRRQMPCRRDCQGPLYRTARPHLRHHTALQQFVQGCQLLQPDNHRQARSTAVAGVTTGIPPEPAEHPGNRNAAHAQTCLALSTAKSSRPSGALLLLALPLPCWSQDVLCTDETDCQRPQRQPSGHQPSPEHHAARPSAHAPSRAHRDTSVGTPADVRV